MVIVSFSFLSESVCVSVCVEGREDGKCMSVECSVLERLKHSP